MRPTRFIINCIELILAFVLGLGGVGLLLLQKQQAYHEENLLAWIGGSLIFLSIAILFLYALLYRRQYFTVKMGGVSILTVEKGVLKEFASRSFREHFPLLNPEMDIFFSKNQQIHIELLFPSFDLEKDSEILERWEKRLGEIFFKQFGYKEEFVIHVGVEV